MRFKVMIDEKQMTPDEIHNSEVIKKIKDTARIVAMKYDIEVSAYGLHLVRWVSSKPKSVFKWWKWYKSMPKKGWYE